MNATNVRNASDTLSHTLRDNAPIIRDTGYTD